MSGYLLSGGLAALLALQSGSAAPSQGKGAKDAPKAPQEIRLNGCIARDKVTPGQFNFLENESGDRYRLSGKGLKDFVGHRVEIVGGPPGKGVTFRTGLLPSPNVAAQAGALDPAQVAIANRTGDGAVGSGKAPLPEFHVVRLRGLDGSCQ